MRSVQVRFECSVVGCDAAEICWVRVRLSPEKNRLMISDSDLPPRWRSLMSDEVRDRWSARAEIFKDRDRTFCPEHSWKES